MKKYILNLSGYESSGMTARQLGELYHHGAISRTTPCRTRRSSVWSTLDDMFPMLKYEPIQSGFRMPRGAGPMRRTVTKLLVAPSPTDMIQMMGSLM